MRRLTLLLLLWASPLTAAIPTNPNVPIKVHYQRWAQTCLEGRCTWGWTDAALGRGSGVLLRASDDKTALAVLTCKHVVTDEKFPDTTRTRIVCSVYLHDGWKPGNVIALSQSYDLAVLSVEVADAELYPTAQIGNALPVNGSPATSRGYAGGLSYTERDGAVYVEAPRQGGFSTTAEHTLFMSMIVKGGESGCGVYQDDYLVGVVWGGELDEEPSLFKPLPPGRGVSYNVRGNGGRVSDRDLLPRYSLATDVLAVREFLGKANIAFKSERPLRPVPDPIGDAVPPPPTNDKPHTPAAPDPKVQEVEDRLQALQEDLDKERKRREALQAKLDAIIVNIPDPDPIETNPPAPDPVEAEEPPDEGVDPPEPAEEPEPPHEHPSKPSNGGAEAARTGSEGGFPWGWVLGAAGLAAGVSGLGGYWLAGKRVVKGVRRVREWRRGEPEEPEYDHDDEDVDEPEYIPVRTRSGRRRVVRRVKQEMERKRAEPEPIEREVIVDAPRRHTESLKTEFVEVPTNEYQRAHERARQQIARRYPGSQEMLEAELSLTHQYLAGGTNP